MQPAIVSVKSHRSWREQGAQSFLCIVVTIDGFCASIIEHVPTGNVEYSEIDVSH